MYIKSQYPDPPPLPEVNAHHIFFKRPDQASWPNFTVHIYPESLFPVEKNAGPLNLVMSPPTRLMFKDYVQDIEDLATGLGASLEDGGLGLRGWEAGIKPESVGTKEGREIIGTIGENSSEYMTLVHACLRITVPFAPISSHSTPFELKHALKLSKATRLFVDEKFLATVLPVAKEVGISADRIHLMKESGRNGKSSANTEKTSFGSLINNVRKHNIPPVDIRPATKGTLAYLVFSSGTTGLPKAVMISHGNLVYSMAQGMAFQQAVAEVYTPPAPKNSEEIPVTLAFLPLHHTYGLHAYCFRSLFTPSTMVILPEWDVKIALDFIQRYKISSLNLVPSVIHQLVNYGGIEKFDLSSVLNVTSGGAYFPPELREKLAKVLPGDVHFTDGYGMSEATIGAIAQPYSGMLGGKARYIPGCTGILIPGIEARVLRAENAIPPSDPTVSTEDDCTLNEPGELWLRSENIASGYWNNPIATRETFVNGWLRTGDRFKVDEDGNFWFVDRAKDTLKISGAQVSPSEIEQCLLSHPAGIIIDATVAGVSGHGRTSDEKVPRAWIVLSDIGKDVSRGWGKEKVVDELERWHKGNLSKYKWLRGGIEVVNEIPKSSTGKVLRRILQDRYEKALNREIKGTMRGKL